MTRQLRWTEHAVTQLGTIAEYLGLASPIYAEQVVDRVVRRLEQAVAYPESGRVVPELAQPAVRELIEPPYRLIYRVDPERITVLSILHGRQEFGGAPEGRPR